MIRKKILIISHLIYPAQSPRSQRATELAIELAVQGNDVTLYAVLGKYDYMKLSAAYGLKIRNIGNLVLSKLNSDGTSGNSLLQRVLIRLFEKLLEFPDIELLFRIPRLISREENVDLLISVAKPYAVHFGCALAKSLNKKSFPKKWIADCGDPFMGDAFDKPYFYFKYLEKWFCKNADFLSVPTENVIENYYSEFRNKIKVIPQGFKFTGNSNLSKFTQNPVPTFAYAGVFYKEKRDPTPFLEFLSSLEPDFRFIIYTKDDTLIKPYYDKLGNKLDVRNYIERNQLLYELGKMDFLVLIENLNNYGSPSKLIDYAIVNRPILSIPSDNIPYEKIKEFLRGDYKNRLVVNNLERYNISNVARQFMSLIK